MKHQSARLAAFVAAALGVSFSTAAMADEVTGPYIQGDIGLANVKVDDDEKFKVRDTFKDLKNSYKDSGFMPRVSAGYDFGDVRVAGDYTHYKNMNDSAQKGNEQLDVKVKAQGMGASVIYDVPLQSNFQPYVGARISANRLKYESHGVSAVTRSHTSESKTKVGYGAMAGVGYKFSNNLAADVGYRYNRLDSDLKAHEVSAGVRYTFN